MAKQKSVKSVNRPTQAMAIAGLILNIIVIPGLGSLINSRKEGLWQIIFFIAGIGLLFYGIFSFSAMGSYALVLLVTGGILLLIAWIWGLITGIHLIKEAK